MRSQWISGSGVRVTERFVQFVCRRGELVSALFLLTNKSMFLFYTGRFYLNRSTIIS